MRPGKLSPSTIVTGRTTRTADPAAPGGWRALAGVQALGPDDDADQADQDQRRDQDLGHGQEPHRVADPRTDEVEQQRADGEADQEDAQDHREDVGRVAGARGQQPGPQDLVAERGQARHERDRQGERPARPPIGAGRTRRHRASASGPGIADGSGGPPAGCGAERRGQDECHDPGERRARRPDPQRAARGRAARSGPAPPPNVPDDRADRVRRVQPPERLAQVRVRR